MAGWVHPAMDGPAGQERGQGAADGAAVAEDVRGLVEGDELPEGDLAALEGGLKRGHARHSGLVRYLGRVLENEATVGRGFGGQLRGDAVDKRRFVQPAELPRGGLVGEWAVDGQDRARRGGRTGGQATADFVRKNSLPTDACRSVGAERNPGIGPGHPIRTRFVLVDGAGTALALALVAGGDSLWSVEHLQRLVGASRCGQPGRLWIEAKLLVYLRSAAFSGPFGAVSRFGQPGSLGSSSPAAGSPAACLNQWSPGEPSLRCSAWWRTPCPGRRSRRLTYLEEVRF